MTDFLSKKLKVADIIEQFDGTHAPFLGNSSRGIESRFTAAPLESFVGCISELMQSTYIKDISDLHGRSLFEALCTYAPTFVPKIGRERMSYLTIMATRKYLYQFTDYCTRTLDIGSDKVLKVKYEGTEYQMPLLEGDWIFLYPIEFLTKKLSVTGQSKTDFLQKLMKMAGYEREAFFIHNAEKLSVTPYNFSEDPDYELRAEELLLHLTKSQTYTAPLEAPTLEEYMRSIVNQFYQLHQAAMKQAASPTADPQSPTTPAVAPLQMAPQHPRQSPTTISIATPQNSQFSLQVISPAQVVRALKSRNIVTTLLQLYIASVVVPTISLIATTHEVIVVCGSDSLSVFMLLYEDKRIAIPKKMNARKGKVFLYSSNALPESVMNEIPTSTLDLTFEIRAPEPPLATPLKKPLPFPQILKECKREHFHKLLLDLAYNCFHLDPRTFSTALSGHSNTYTYAYSKLPHKILSSLKSFQDSKFCVLLAKTGNMQELSIEDVIENFTALVKSFLFERVMWKQRAVRILSPFLTLLEIRGMSGWLCIL